MAATYVSQWAKRAGAAEESRVSEGLEITFKTLQQSPNRAVGDVLAFAYECREADVRRLAIESILRTSRGPGSIRVVQTWHELAGDLRESITHRPRALVGAIRDSLHSDDRQVVENALDLSMRIGEPQLVPELVRIAEDERSALRPRATEALLCVAEKLAAEASKKSRRTVGRTTLRSQVIECLEKSIERYREHRCLEIVEAFLMIAGCGNAFLKRCLRSPRSMSMPAITKLLTESQHPSILNGVLVEALGEADLPAAFLRVWSQRSDLSFIHAFCRRIGRFPDEVLRQNLRRVSSFRWLKGSLQPLLDLDATEQIGVVQLIKCAKLDENDLFRVIEFLMVHGEPEAKRRAAERLEDVRTSAADRLVRRFVEDEDPSIQAMMLSQLRTRRIAGATSRLMEALDSEHPQVRHAARNAFPDVDMDRYLSTFEQQDDESQRASGALVLKIDTNALPKLANELRKGTRNRRLRAVQVVNVLNLVEDLQESVAEVLKEDDFFVRLQAVHALGKCRTSFSRRALRDALMDPSNKVRHAAEKALQQMARIPDPNAPRASTDDAPVAPDETAATSHPSNGN